MRVLALLSLSLASAAALAAPILDPANGHYYERVDNALSWTDADLAASASTYDPGTGALAGHLATITSQAENDFLKANFTPTDAWLGASQDGTETAPDQGFKWVTGEAFSYTNWASGEPNDDGGPLSEEYLQMRGSADFDWNDEAGANAFPYYVEYEAVPEPASVVALGVGIAAVLRRRRR